MTTTYIGYSTPQVLTASPVSNGKMKVYGTGPTEYLVEVRSGMSSGLTIYPCITTTYSTVQVQSRVRHRYNLASGLVIDPTGAEVWTDFADWSSPGTSTTSMTAASWEWWDTIKYAAGQSQTFSYDLSTYDMHEMEVRARVYNASNDTASEWGYATTRIVYRPELTACTATTQSDGSLSMTFSTNFARGARLELTKFQRCNDAFVANNVLAGESGIDIHRAYLVKTTASGVSAGSVWAKSAKLITSDGAGTGHWQTGTAYVAPTEDAGDDGGCSLIASSAGGYVVAPGSHVNPSDVPNPTVTVTSATGTACVLSISCACDHVVARAEYTDADGNSATVMLDVTGGTSTWTATLDSPPYGVPITIKTACCNASGAYKLATNEITAITGEHASLDGDGDHVGITYNGEFDQNTELAGESVQVAGRKLPVSRHGQQVSRTFAVKGTIVFPSVFPNGDMELSGLNVLDNPHDWLFRNPAGMRRRVRVVSWGTTQDTGQLGRVAEVTINMEEVG